MHHKLIACLMKKCNELFIYKSAGSSEKVKDNCFTKNLTLFAEYNI